MTPEKTPTQFKPATARHPYQRRLDPSQQRGWRKQIKVQRPEYVQQ